MSQFPWDYLELCSITALHSFILAERDAAARHRKQLIKELEKMVEALTNAEVATAIIENSNRLRSTIELRQNSFAFERSMATPGLPTRQEIELLSRKLSP